MDFFEIRIRLETTPGLEDIDDWQVETISMGGVSPHKYRFRSQNHDYFVKETKDNESQALQMLESLELDICPKVVFPELLKENILVAEYIPGGVLQDKKLDQGLVINYCAMQNAFNDRQLFGSLEPFTQVDYSDRDDAGFYRALLPRGCREGYPKLVALRQYNLPIVDDYIRVADLVRAYEDQIAGEYSAMPFGWLHHDFREDNIVGSPQKLVDWGSSYGHGPFLFDLAPFLINDEMSLRTFVAQSDICHRASPTDIERWVFIATCATFVGFWLWRIKDPDEPGGNWTTRNECRDFLEYEFEPFRALIDHRAAVWQ